MDNQKFKKGIEELRNIRLKDGEKSIGLARLRAYMKNNPAPVESPFWQPINTFFFRNAAVYMVLLCLAVLSGGVIKASENSLPGDLLYPVKINVSEPLESAIIFNPVDKVNWEIEKIDLRMEEAENLAVSGNLNEENLGQIENNIDSHSAAFSDRVKEEEDKGNSQAVEDAKINLENNMDVHIRVLDKIVDKTDLKDKDNIEKFKNSFKQRRKDLKISANLRLGDEATTSIDKKEEKIKSVIEKVQIKINTNRKKELNNSTASTSVETIKQAILDDAQKSIDDLKISLDEVKDKRIQGLNVDPSFDLNASERKAAQIDNYVKQGLRLGDHLEEN